MRRLPDLALYLVLDPVLCDRHGHGMLATARAAVAGGVTAVQLRHKTASTADRIALGRALMAALDGTGAALIVNDDAAAATAIGAHGLHIGQDDTDPATARAAIGPAMILGLSVETPQAAAAIDPTLVDYAGAGPVFATQTKPDHRPATGWDGLTRIIAACPVPAVAIGGLNATHTAPARAAGAVGLAVVSAICGQPDPAAAARSFKGTP